MGRRKQKKPHRSVSKNEGTQLQSTSGDLRKEQRDKEITKDPILVEVDRVSWLLSSDELRYDLSEVVLHDLEFGEAFSGHMDFFEENCVVRFRLSNVGDFRSRIKLGHWPVLSGSSINLEFIKKDVEGMAVILCGHFDGPDDGLTGLVHLASLKFLTLRPVVGEPLTEEVLSVRIRVELLRNAFHNSRTLLDNSRESWRKSMMNLMAWLRPEVLTSEMRYRVRSPVEVELDSHVETGDSDSVTPRPERFDAAGFYEAIKPSKEEPMLEEEFLDLLPKLRPYQRRATYWMVQRELGPSGHLDGKEINNFFSPFCVPVEFVDTCSRMFYNPFSGSISLLPGISSDYVFGGILADEMGLGKTIELLACIFAHRRSAKEDSIVCIDEIEVNGDQKIDIKRLKRERIECVCGAVTENLKYKGLWVQCDICDAWQHAECVNYSQSEKLSTFTESINSKKGYKPTGGVKKPERKQSITNVIVTDEEYICQLCSELIQATHSPIATGATLIVCPAPILPQWQGEIIRHTRPGSLKTCVYEGVRRNSTSDAPITDLSELVNSDIVLTTYDILKEDLSHDSDRHERDRRCMRFGKRYPVIPTLLTRVYWWRICLDEAQMVESNCAAATEMALRLHGKHRWCITGTPIQRRLDDLYGLLKFLRVSPFDVFRWWVEILRDPYERRDVRAMDFTHKLFKSIMWRSSKAHVADELQLPPQENCLSWLSFSPIEEHFYQRQHDTCVSYACEVIERFKDDFLKRNIQDATYNDGPSDPYITHAEAAKLLHSLLKLRQACCHPQVGSSGLRSLQQSPMTMDEILQVLIGKTKTEGEEALRSFVSASNGLAGIAIIKGDPSQAVALYKESLVLTKEHSEDFRLDPLLSLHIHHNLVELLLKMPEYSENVKPKRGLEENYCQMSNIEEHDLPILKKRKLTREDNLYWSTHPTEISGYTSDKSVTSRSNDPADASVSPKSSTLEYLKQECENIRQKYLCAFSSKLSLAQHDFCKSYAQVCSALKDGKDQAVWWLNVLYHIEKKTETSVELLKKVEDAVSGALHKKKASKLSSCFRSLGALKYYIQTGLDSLETSRTTLMERLLEIDQTMDKARDEDIERVRYCPNCQLDGNGRVCVHCELDELFQVYEARLFRMNKESGGMITSADEVVDLQKKKSALNRFYWTLSQPKSTSSFENDENIKRRSIGEKVVVSKAPSDLEVILGVIKSYSKAHMQRDDFSSAKKHLVLLESMRKEYTSARSLAITQAQVLRAYDEIKMATSRLHLRDNEADDRIDALSSEQLDEASMQNTQGKFVAFSSLSRIKGQLRYLKGLAIPKHKLIEENHDSSSSGQDMDTSVLFPSGDRNESLDETDMQSCPVCQEKLRDRKMVFQCGHLTCCKCLFAMTERQQVRAGKSLDKWVMCPVCRQHTDFGNIAYAFDGKETACNCSMLHALGRDSFESSLTIQGSYGTKIEAVTRRILWIKSGDPKAKIIVFSSWNDVIDVLEHALAANDITYIRMKGGRKAHVAISQFRGNSSAGGESKDIQVLLLLIQHGANGLNLLEAQHVVLVEPLLNPAAEAQAISRVHRVGQEHKTLVHRFIVKGTVEESILKLNRSRNASSYISGNKKNQDQPVLTLKDVESLFSVVPGEASEDEKFDPESLTHLPPSVAAVMAAQRRLDEQSG